jgi:Ca2+-transporting ATPase
MAYIMAVNVPIAGLALIPLLFGLPPCFGHIAFLEMVINPVCSIVFEAEGEEHEIMQRPSRHPSEPLFSPPGLLCPPSGPKSANFYNPLG